MDQSLACSATPVSVIIVPLKIVNVHAHQNMSLLQASALKHAGTAITWVDISATMAILKMAMVVHLLALSKAATDATTAAVRQHLFVSMRAFPLRSNFRQSREMKS